MIYRKALLMSILVALLMPLDTSGQEVPALTYVVVDTGQDQCYDAAGESIACPVEGEAFYGQDANYAGAAFDYGENGDGTVSDANTGLMWQQAHNPERLTFEEAQTACESLELGGFDDWRLPALRELYSLVDFRGAVGERFYLNEQFALEADSDPEASGQTWSGTDASGGAAYFVDFLTGHLAQAPRQMRLFYRCVRGDEYGLNEFVRTGSGTVGDAATGLMWQQADDGIGFDWEDALRYCEHLTLARYDDWRLPNIRELQSILDAARTSPALDPAMFAQIDPDGRFWSSTTLGDDPSQAAYLCFGECDGQGAGTQGGDPKAGNPEEFASFSEQGGEVRIYNYVRCVRDADEPMVASESTTSSQQPSTAGQPGGQPPGGGGQQPGTGGQPPAPPQEAIDICADSTAGATCQFTDPQGIEVSGSCRMLQNQLACVPDQQPPR